MGQKVHPNIFRLGKTKTWDYKFFEKKPTETALYSFKSIELTKFISKIFKNNGLISHNCKLSYTDEGSLHVFVSYYLELKSVFLINSITINQKTKLIKQKQSNLIRRKKYRPIKKNIKNLVQYQKIDSNKTFNKSVKKENYRTVKNKIQSEKTTYKIRRMRVLKYYKKYLALRNHNQFNSLKANVFLEKLLKSLHIFLGKKINIIITLKQLNKDLKETLSNKNLKAVKKKLVKLRKYKFNKFFRDGVNVAFISTQQPKSSNLLAKFIATQLSKNKRHNFFLKFVKASLTTFHNTRFSNLKGIKIKIKGRFNGRPRARLKTILIGNGVQALSLNSNMDFSEATSFTPNGTFGVKVWIQEN